MQENYIIEMNNITKIFNKNVIANDNINLKIKKGEIHALLGENGAGKSTLMSILCGLYKPTFGTIKINSNEVVIENSFMAKKLGIGMIHQHFKLVDNFTVWENIALSINDNRMFLRKKSILNEINLILEKYNFKINLNEKISNLSVGDLQKIEIIKILINNIDIFIFDEPTAVLIKSEIKQFLDILNNLKKQGKTIIFISHKLHEIENLSDNVSIMRNGRLISTFPTNSKSIKEIANLMIGRKSITIKNNHNNINNKKTILKIQNLSMIFKKIKYLDNINLDIKQGEILAIAGMSNNGQNQLTETITKINNNYTGKIIINDIDIDKLSTIKIYEHVSYIPEDRIKNGIAINLNVLDNILLQNLYRKPFTNKFGLINRKSNVYYSQNLIKNYDVKGTANGYAPISNLSGGNQQKLIVGREIEKPHKLLIVSNPTRGVDLGSLEYIHKKILNEKQKGNAVLLISTELEEIIQLADRVMVMSFGKINGELQTKDINEENIGMLFLNKNEKELDNEKK